MATLGMFGSASTLVSVAPLYAVHGGAGPAVAGATTGVLMATTVLVQILMDRLLRRYSLRGLLMVGALLLGVPAFGYALSATAAWVLAVSALRGVGFGVITVAGSALLGELVPHGQRGRAIGRYGISVGLPTVVLLPVAVYVARQYGFLPVFLVAGAMGVATVPVVAAMASGRDTARDRPAARQEGGVLQRYRPLTGPWLAVTVVALAMGGVTSFLPLALADPATAATALFVLAVTMMVGRWASGGFGDRVGSGRLLVPGVLACVLGMAGYALAAGMSTGSLVVAIVAATCGGLGFGALQNDALAMMFHRAGPGGTGTASTAWNMALDAGNGAGAVMVGLGSQWIGINGAFAATGVLVAAVLPVAVAASRRERHAQHRATPSDVGAEPRAGRPV